VYRFRGAKNCGTKKKKLGPQELANASFLGTAVQSPYKNNLAKKLSASEGHDFLGLLDCHQVKKSKFSLDDR
jgi:hypothetical protein